MNFDVMKVIRLLRPRDSYFFTAFAQHSKESHQAVNALLDMINIEGPPDDVYRWEKNADRSTRAIQERVRNVMLSPFDRSEVMELTVAIDDIADCAKTIATSIHTTGIHVHTSRSVDKQFQEYMCDMVTHASNASLELYNALCLLPKTQHDTKTISDIQAILKKIRSIESAGDKTYRNALWDIFTPYRDERSTKNLEEVILYRDVLKEMERLIDRCEDAADALDTILTNRA